MRFSRTAIDGAWLIELERFSDDRGSFARAYCEEAFAEHGLMSRFVQSSVSTTLHLHTLRGMHYQAEPHGEAKLIRCSRGRIYDVLVDLRPDSPTHLKWLSVELTPEAANQLYAPSGVAHGFVTLEPDTEVTYQISYPYTPEASRGVRWNDPALGIQWPVSDPTMNERDRTFPDLIL
ncbi:MAG: dTDP-4-dehydrorhamnose 3,5-epimerase [Myxococcota bacterium]|nr:dTDP-4-dehydrorhamnose 3,5-epimerase [Myxococcota bacterium]